MVSRYLSIFQDISFAVVMQSLGGRETTHGKTFCLISPDWMFDVRSVYLAVLLDKMGAMMVLPLLPFIARSSLGQIG